MPLDVDALLSAPPVTTPAAWTDRDVLLYHLSLGAGLRNGEPELKYVFEPSLRVLPTFALVAGLGISAATPPRMPLELLPVRIELADLLHVGQSLDVPAPLPPTGRADVETRATDVWDKGRAAVIEVTQTARDAEDGHELWVSTMQMWVTGAGGFGGDPGPRPAKAEFTGEPDWTITSSTRPDQAMLYRLNGDLNPLHLDPSFAAKAGFERPILHGLATYGVVAKAVVDELFDGDPRRLRHFSTRFAGVVHPGETLETRVWARDGELGFSTSCPERGDVVVLSQGIVRGER